MELLYRFGILFIKKDSEYIEVNEKMQKRESIKNKLDEARNYVSPGRKQFLIAGNVRKFREFSDQIFVEIENENSTYYISKETLDLASMTSSKLSDCVNFHLTSLFCVIVSLDIYSKLKF